jgi:hypothetical protein
VTPNQYFGGCAGNPTAGTLCCSRTQHFFVATNGSDSLSGTSPTAAFRTITHAVSKATAGDTVYVAEGTYEAISGEIFPLHVPAGVTVIGNETNQGRASLDGGTGAVVLRGVGSSDDGSWLGLIGTSLIPTGATMAGFDVDGSADGGIAWGYAFLSEGGGTARNNHASGFAYGGGLQTIDGGSLVVGNVFENNYYGIFAGTSSNYVGYTRVEHNRLMSNQVGVSTSRYSGLDLGGGVAGSNGGNDIACNSMSDLSAAALVKARNNLWNHAPPTVSDAGTDGVDIFLEDGGVSVDVTGYSTSPLTVCDAGVTP